MSILEQFYWRRNSENFRKRVSSEFLEHSIVMVSGFLCEHNLSRNRIYESEEVELEETD